MYRLLIVDDEEIITDSLYEVFAKLMPDELDVCKAYSATEALNWMSRTRIDIVLTDISMPGMNGLELTEEIHAYWPRCKVIFLTGHSEFDYAYKAIQMHEVRYLLKTEGYDKVMQTVQGVIDEINRGNQMSELVEQSREQKLALELMAQRDYFMHLLQDSPVLCRDQETLAKEFRSLNIRLDPTFPVVLVIGRLSYPADTSYSERSRIVHASERIWNSCLSEQARYVGNIDKHGDNVWFLQPSQHAAEKFDSHFIRYLEGTLELVQETVLIALGLTTVFAVSGASNAWEAITPQYERLRQLQQLKHSEGISVIITDRIDQPEASEIKGTHSISQKAEIMAAHIEADRKVKFDECLDEVTTRLSQADANVQQTIEAYYSIALVLFSYINRWGLHRQICDCGKLMRLDNHLSIKEAFQYLSQIADSIFSIKRLDEKDRASGIIDQICQFIHDHLSEDLSLVRLAEINYFNPTYLSRFFKQERSINLSEYIDRCRIKKAMELLRDGDLKVREVAVSVGYEAAHSFTRFFKKETGMTPQEYRDTIPIG
ncbi:response regulator transcription factor [Cohnella luojiensis]|uniref:Response regulator n=1 Tax=Cohnella luojiensis TaxID=652876 RepID=A0A4Y8M0Q2_9BACL|nr:response regulator [Cohnella luojiensis]TFE27503.1 response regulator [Cohnella luojiensis]